MFDEFTGLKVLKTNSKRSSWQFVQATPSSDLKLGLCIGCFSPGKSHAGSKGCRTACCATLWWKCKALQGDKRVPFFLGEATLHKVSIPRTTWCPVEDWKVEDWPARTGAAESRTPTPTHTPTSLVATKPYFLRMFR